MPRIEITLPEQIIRKMRIDSDSEKNVTIKKAVIQSNVVKNTNTNKTNKNDGQITAKKTVLKKSTDKNNLVNYKNIIKSKKDNQIILKQEELVVTNNLKFANLEPKEIKMIKEQIEDKDFDVTKLETSQVEENNPQETTVIENEPLSISLPKSGWLIKSISSNIIKLNTRTNYDDKTYFIFSTNSAGIADIVFLRYDPDTNIIQRLSYKITVKPKNLFENDNKQTKKTTTVTKIKPQDNKKEDFRRKLADDLFAQGKYSEAKGRYDALIKEGKVDAQIYYKMGIIEKETGNDANALDNFQKNIKEKDNPNYAEALTEIMKLLKKQKKYSEAIDSFYNYGFSDAITPESSEELYLILSDVYFSMNDFVSAAKEYRRFMGNYPKSLNTDKALFYLAYSIENYAKNPDFKEAYKIYKQIISDYPESKYFQLSKNRMLYLERHYLKVN
jgi:hypothetical protein